MSLLRPYDIVTVPDLVPNERGINYELHARTRKYLPFIECGFTDREAWTSQFSTDQVLTLHKETMRPKPKPRKKTVL